MADDFYTDMRDEDLYDEAHTTQAMLTCDDWCDITELDDEKRGPALRDRLEGGAAIYKKILETDALKNKEEGVLCFKRTLRLFF
ncbi:unnamed protein product, partial [Symbiodinium pilosum]